MLHINLAWTGLLELRKNMLEKDVGPMDGSTPTNGRRCICIYREPHGSAGEVQNRLRVANQHRQYVSVSVKYS